MFQLAELNEQQREAVLHEQGPLLVLAGAGSGKTRVITYRIAHLMKERSVAAANILAVTFTNKAAEEMRERVKELVGDHDTVPIVATFHSFCLRILRKHIHTIGYPNSFSIYDVDDQVALIRRILKDMDCENESPRAIQGRISSAKNSKYKPAVVFQRDIDEHLLDIYNNYQKAMKVAGALDFDDILLVTNKLLESEQKILDFYRNRFEYIMVDEYQDTNFPQYDLIRKLAHPKNNVCAVGDDDQSIYRWRGADVENILNFSKDFPGTRVIKLEQNYRSTQNILDGAHGVVENLLGRHPKKLWTNKGNGEKITYFLADDESSEASFVVREINSMLALRKPSDFAVLFRTNAQSRSFEEALGRHKIPYQLIGGTRFYDRKEIKDILAYIQIAVNSDDIVSFRRTINNPTRGIGDVTIAKLESLAEKENISIWEAITTKMSFLGVTPSAKKGLNKFRTIIQSISALIEHGEAPSLVIDHILKESDYLSTLIKEGTEEAFGRLDNIKELIVSAKSFEIGNPDSGTMEYLDQVSLVADTDNFDPGSPKATLMTLHCAKGLEFEVVFLVGMEDGLLPHSRNSDDPDMLEEERRLCYVGMTRAKEKLFLVGARSRRTYNGTIVCNPSRFLIDVPLSALDERGSERLALKKRLSGVGANIDNISKFFKEKNIPVNMGKLEKHSQDRKQGEFRKGDHVLLTKYGKGTIVATEGDGEELRYIVYFPNIGQRKKLLARVAKLTRV